MPTIPKPLWPRLFSLPLLFVFLALATPKVQANAVVLLEEPYSYDGAFAGTGHTAVYLPRVCAETPLVLRRCKDGEFGTVISRYTRIAGRDWIAVPLVAYLYAVERKDDIPLYADARLVAFLRDQYRRKYLEDLIPDAPGGDTPKGDWVQLVGSAYDRSDYGFEIETSPNQDDALIFWLNSLPNRKSYNAVTNNCANFVAEVLNFYYPHSETRGSVGDLWVRTPKHDAKSIVRYSKRHPDLKFTHYVIPQVPGTLRRSKPVRGVLESVFRAKKYVAALALFHPFIAGGVLAVDLANGGFNPAKNAEVFNLAGNFEPPLSKETRRSYLKDLESAAKLDSEDELNRDANTWKKFEAKAQPGLNADGHPVIEAEYNDEHVELGIAVSDFASSNAPSEIQTGLLISRLKQTLARSRTPRISNTGLQEDWSLLEKISDGKQAKVSGTQDSHPQSAEELGARGTD